MSSLDFLIIVILWSPIKHAYEGKLRIFMKDDATKNIPTCAQYFRLNKNTNEMEIKWKRLCSFYKLVLIPKTVVWKSSSKKGKMGKDFWYISNMCSQVHPVHLSSPISFPALLSHVRPLGLGCFIILIHYYNLVLPHTKILWLADEYPFVHSADIYWEGLLLPGTALGS